MASDRARALWMARKLMRVEAPLLTWTAVHGNLCLALRHPQNRGDSRPWVVAFVKSLGQKLVEVGAMSKDMLERAERLEAEEGSAEFKGA